MAKKLDPITPGEILLEEFMHPLGVSQNKLARDIAKRVQEELRYPGEIKVNVIRENRVVEFAR